MSRWLRWNERAQILLTLELIGLPATALIGQASGAWGPSKEIEPWKRQSSETSAMSHDRGDEQWSLNSPLMIMI